ncbi:uncharacterized protein [Odocoileus virginianus]|uniref:Basic proline-rich protein-like n=1 Tax=Odocoileus virginianus TaxID=9874 RepID=A0ABM4IDN5_ODOVR
MNQVGTHFSPPPVPPNGSMPPSPPHLNRRSQAPSGTNILGSGVTAADGPEGFPFYRLCISSHSIRSSRPGLPVSSPYRTQRGARGHSSWGDKSPSTASAQDSPVRSPRRRVCLCPPGPQSGHPGAEPASARPGPSRVTPTPSLPLPARAPVGSPRRRACLCPPGPQSGHPGAEPASARPGPSRVTPAPSLPLPARAPVGSPRRRACLCPPGPQSGHPGAESASARPGPSRVTPAPSLPLPAQAPVGSPRRRACLCPPGPQSGHPDAEPASACPGPSRVTPTPSLPLPARTPTNEIYTRAAQLEDRDAGPTGSRRGEEDADDGNQQTLEPGPLSVKPPVQTDGLPAIPQPGLCRGRTASAHHGCPALGPPASSQWADSVTRVTRSLGRPFHSGPLLPRSPGP